MNEKIKEAIDQFVKNKRPNNRLRGHFVQGGGGLLGHTHRNDSRVVEADYYEEVKNVIIEAQINHQVPLSCQEYEDAIKYACKELGF